MEGNQTSYCTVLDKKDQSKFVCYISVSKQSGLVNIGLTNACDVWITDFTEDSLRQFRQKFASQSTEDYILKIRSACSSGGLTVSVQDTIAVLHVGSSSENLSVPLCRLSEAEAREELKELLFRMVDNITQSSTAGSVTASPSASPLKSHQRQNTEFEPRKHQQNGPSVTVKKRLPGDSLINPGTKRKRQATGVAFDDEDNDS
ncbi:protein PAXX [Aplochiton taeniatus]